MLGLAMLGYSRVGYARVGYARISQAQPSLAKPRSSIIYKLYYFLEKILKNTNNLSLVDYKLLFSYKYTSLLNLCMICDNELRFSH